MSPELSFHFEHKVGSLDHDLGSATNQRVYPRYIIESIRAHWLPEFSIVIMLIKVGNTDGVLAVYCAEHFSCIIPLNSHSHSLRFLELGYYQYPHLRKLRLNEINLKLYSFTPSSSDHSSLPTSASIVHDSGLLDHFRHTDTSAFSHYSVLIVFACLF